VAQRYQAPGAVLLSIREKLASARNRKPEEILDAVVDALAEGRGYAFAGIYLAVENLGVRQASSGSSRIAQAGSRSAGAAATVALEAVDAEIAVPIRLGARTLGLIVVETRRTLGPQGATAHGAARQERVLVQQVAKLVAQYLTTDRAKQLLRKTREQARQAAAAQPHKSPQSTRPALRRTAAGER
jgi:GAF domain-containing protein